MDWISKNLRERKGAAMLLATVFFLIISLTIILGIAGPILSQKKISADLLKSRQSFFLAEAGLDDVVYRLKNGMEVASEGETIEFEGNQVVLSVENTLNGKRVRAEGDWLNFHRKIETELILGEGAAFHYGVQSGNGGFHIQGGASVTGNLYSNGPITLHTNTITGNAVSALAQAAPQIYRNINPLPPPVTLAFDKVGSERDIAQSFIPDSDVTINTISAYIRRVEYPNDLTVRITTDNNGQPANSSIATSQIPTWQVGTSFSWFSVNFSSPPTLNAGQKYWIVFDGSSNQCNQSYCKRFEIGANSAISGEQAKIGQYGGSWNDTNPAGLDLYIEAFSGEVSSGIAGVSGGTPTIIGNAWAMTVSNVNVGGELWCDNAVSTNKPCDNSHGYPSPQPMPISESMIQSWKDEVSNVTSSSGSWEQSGSMTVPWNGIVKNNPLRINGNLSANCTNQHFAIFNDLEITGNLTTGSGCNVIVEGVLKVGGSLTIGGDATFIPSKTIWVSGNVVFHDKMLKLAPSYENNSGLIIVDGRITLSGGFPLEGSGQESSYPILVSTSSCPSGSGCNNNPAIDITAGSGAVVAIAPNGTIRMSGGVGVRSIVADRIEILNGHVNYDSGLADISFSSGPSGGFNISSWKEY